MTRGAGGDSASRGRQLASDCGSVAMWAAPRARHGARGARLSDDEGGFRPASSIAAAASARIEQLVWSVREVMACFSPRAMACEDFSRASARVGSEVLVLICSAAMDEPPLPATGWSWWPDARMRKWLRDCVCFAHVAVGAHHRQEPSSTLQKKKFEFRAARGALSRGGARKNHFLFIEG